MARHAAPVGPEQALEAADRAVDVTVCLDHSGRLGAAVRGFGAVYTDIDRRENTAFEYFDRRGRSLGEFAVPPEPSGLSFLGVVFRKPVVARVKIEYGTGPLGPADSSGYDAAVMDDFVYGEPQALRRRARR